MRKPATLAAFIPCLICGHPDSAANKSPFDDLYARKKNISGVAKSPLIISRADGSH